MLAGRLLVRWTARYCTSPVRSYLSLREIEALVDGVGTGVLAAVGAQLGGGDYYSRAAPGSRESSVVLSQ